MQDIKKKDKDVKDPKKGGDLVTKQFRAETVKLRGNECLKANDFDEAIQHYTKSLQILEQPHVLNNRSLAYYKKKCFREAERDAHRAIELDPNVAKSYLRRAMALRSQGR